MYLDGKNINMDDIPIFRELPCNKDIYYANALINFNNFGYKRGNILGAIILKWVRDGKIILKNLKKGIFNKDCSIIDLSLNPVFEYDMEDRLFNMMHNVSKDGILFVKDFEKLCRKNKAKLINIVDTIMIDQVIKLKKSGDISYGYLNIIPSYINVMSNKIYDDSVKLYGLKKYLEEFSVIDDKEVMDVKLWDEYLMFAYLFGNADKVFEQLNGMYLDDTEHSMNFLETLEFINNVTLFINDTVSIVSTMSKLVSFFSIKSR